jgi:ketosteroid isomerase-like protein
MRRRYLAALLVTFAVSFSPAAESHRSSQKTSHRTIPSPALMQTILDGWSSLDPADAAKFYAHGPNTFFDLTPLKYNSWEEYEDGVRKIVGNYRSIKFTLNDDARVHTGEDYAWGAATIQEDALLKNGKREMATLRWTVIWQKQNGQWLIVHDHTSEPLH